MISSAAELFKAAGLRTKTITVLGAELTIRELSVAGQRRLASEPDAKKSAAVLLRECLIAPDGSPLLTQEDADRLSEVSAAFVDEVGGQILKFSKVDKAEEKKD